MEQSIFDKMRSPTKTAVSHIPELVRARHYKKTEFVGLLMVNGIGQDTAYRLVNGETNFTIDTLSKVASILGAGLGDLISFD